MKICVFALLIISLVTDQSLSESDIINLGYQVTLAVPTDYTKGFVGRAFLIETDQNPPHFRAAISVEAVEEAEKYACSLDVFLGDVRVWSSGHFSRFYSEEKCVLELTELGSLRLKGQSERVGWRTGTSRQGVKRLSLLRTGNLVLVDEKNSIKWQSFNFPTDIMVWGQRLSSKTRLTAFPPNSTLFYSMEIKDDKIQLFLNFGKSKYSYWDYTLSGKRNITFVQLTSYGLEIFNGNHKFDQIKSPGTTPYSEPLRFLSLDKTTGNLRMYHYSEGRGKFEASYQALNSTCDLPTACKPYGICTPSGSCSCISLVANAHAQPGCNEAKDLEGQCGSGKTEMVELQGVVSVLRSDSYKDVVGKHACSGLCNEDCSCVAVQYVEGGSSGQCFVYKVARGMKTVERGDSRVVYMVKVGGGGVSGKNSGLKKWVIVVVGVVDGFVIFLVLGGVGFYIFWKRRKNLVVTRQGN